MNIVEQRSVLLAERQRIEERQADSNDYQLDAPMRETLSELSLYDNHPADIASELFEREKDMGLAIADENRIAEIDRALAAMDEGTYGTCATCGRWIGEERLQAYPSSLQCVACKQAEEASHPNQQRPVEETVLTPPFMKSDVREADGVEFDDEDSWQAVGRFDERRMIYETMYMDDDAGIVDDIDAISNEQYKNQLP